MNEDEVQRLGETDEFKEVLAVLAETADEPWTSELLKVAEGRADDA